EDSSASSSTICATARRRVRKKTSIQEENREHIRTDYSSRARPPVHAEGKIDALGSGRCVPLSAGHRPRILVAVALLGRCDFGRSSCLSHAPSLGRPYFFRGGL